MILYRHKDLIADITRVASDVAESDFYARKFNGHSLEKFETLPFLTRSELVTTPIAQRTYVSDAEIAFFGFSSGTTSGVPLVSVFGAIENYHVEPAFGTAARRPLIVYPPLNKNFGASFIQQCREAVVKLSPVFGDYERLANSAVLAQMTQCDSIYATPTIALKLAPYLEKHYDVSQIQFLAVASEFLTPVLWAQLRRAYPKALISNLYASSEIGQFIMYTEPSAGEYTDTFILMTEAIAAAELIDTELIITYTTNPAFPLIRYATGDRFELVEDANDGRIRLRMTGRSGVDVIKVGGFEIRSADVDAWVASVPQAAFEYQLHIFEQENGKYRLRFEWVSGPAAGIDMSVIESLLTTSFKDTFKIGAHTTVAAAIESGLIEPDACVTCVNQVEVVAQKRRVLVLHPYSGN